MSRRREVLDLAAQAVLVDRAATHGQPEDSFALIAELRRWPVKPRLLDLFCGAGGCSAGYAAAGFDVVGVDVNPQPRYPYRFVQADAMEVLGGSVLDLDGFDVIHASPPCQAYSVTRHTHGKEHPDLVPAVLERLETLGKPWVVENVPGAPMPGALVLCGSEFGLTAYDPASGRVLWLRRHRLFASSVFLLGAGGCNCSGREIGGVYGHGGGSSDRTHARDVRRGGYTPSQAVRRQLMGIDWMPGDRLSQAIPPAYTEFVGRQLLDHLASPRLGEGGAGPATDGLVIATGPAQTTGDGSGT